MMYFTTGVFAISLKFAGSEKIDAHTVDGSCVVLLFLFSFWCFAFTHSL